MPFRYFPWGKYLPLDGSKAMDDLKGIKFTAGGRGVLIGCNPYSNALRVRNLADTAYEDILVSQIRFIDIMFADRSSGSAYIATYDSTWHVINVAEVLAGAAPCFNIPLAGDITFYTNAVGPILTDRTTGTKYRLYVDDGVLSIEAI